MFQSRCRDLVDGKLRGTLNRRRTDAFQSRCRDLVDGKLNPNFGNFQQNWAVSVPLPGFS